MTVLDKVMTAFENFKHGEEMRRTEIVHLVNSKYGVNKGSIIPSDYCYNLVNLDKLSNPSLLEFNLFEYVESSRYIYIGKNQKYNGPIYHKICLKYEEVGHWTNGVRTFDYTADNKHREAAQDREKCSLSSRPSDKEKRHLSPEIRPLEVAFKAYTDNSRVSKLWNSGSKKDWENALDDYWGAVALDNMRHELAFIHKQLFSFNHKDIGMGLGFAKQILGLGTSGASGLLAVLFPHEFGTVDQFVVKALCEVDGLREHVQIECIDPESIKVKDGILIISILRRKALELNKSFGTSVWTPRMIDKVLWAVGRV